MTVMGISTKHHVIGSCYMLYFDVVFGAMVQAADFVSISCKIFCYDNFLNAYYCNHFAERVVNYLLLVDRRKMMLILMSMMFAIMCG